ncbi:DGQHR domain-containing protein [Sodalinema gerasimenkoae]|uniref:DGQHR domain-containing protein n=1 Tax=Sodalinema gerasimenkoae TaxID=2862348 RepID=UPI001358784A|nr:DGQHR domain-containing protein [Sodalinema gerasimenkoae]
MILELKNVLKVEDQLGLVYYLGTLSPLNIKNLTFVPVVAKNTGNPESSTMLEERPQGGYQRAGDVKRMKKIKDFIMERSDCIIPPVLLSARGKWEFIPNGKNPQFGLLKVNDLAAIIDGQHRLGGLLQLAIDDEIPKELKERPIPFMAIDNIDPTTEEKEFIDINDNQKGVKKSLTRFLSRDQNFSGQAAYALMNDEESVFYGRIDSQKKYDWTLFLFGAAQECIELMFNHDFRVTKGFDPEQNSDLSQKAIQYILDYWKTVKNCMPELWSDIEKMPDLNQKRSKDYPGTRSFQYRLLEETGIRAFSKLASELFSMTWVNAAGSPAFEKIDIYLKAMSRREKVVRVLTKPKTDPTVLEIDPGLKSTGKAGVDAIFRHLKAELQQVIQEN